MFKKRAPEEEISATDACALMEKNIEQATARIATARAGLKDASVDASAHADARKALDFAEFQRRNLIEERISLEPSRLEEVAAAAESAFDRENPLPQLVLRRDRLVLELDQVTHDIAVGEFAVRRLLQSKTDAQRSLVTLRSDRPANQPARAQIERDLRARLETIGDNRQ